MDIEERKELIDSMIPKEHQSYFYRLIRKGGFNALPTRGKVAIHPKTFERCVCIFTTIIDWEEYRDISPRQFMLSALMLGYAGEHGKVYQQLSRSAQRFFVNMAQESGHGAWDSNIYLEILVRLDSVPNAPLMSPRKKEPSRVTITPELALRRAIQVALEEVAKDAENNNSVCSLDLNYPTENFLKLMKAKTPPAFNNIDRCATEILFLWKLYYGEQTVTEFYERFKDYSYPLRCDQMFAILDDWNELAQYPSEWIVSLYPAR